MKHVQRSCLASFAMIVIFMLCVSGNISAQGEAVFKIDSSINTADAAVMARVMKNLDETDRENVLFIDLDGTVRSNKQELLHTFIKNNVGIMSNEGKFPINDFIQTSETDIFNGKPEIVDSLLLGNESLISPSGYLPPVYTCGYQGTGPYRRAPSISGFSRLTANVYLPSKALGEVYMPSVTGTPTAKIYTGQYTKAGGIDFGLSLNYAPGSALSMETWGMEIHGHNGGSGPLGNFKMGTSVFMKTYVPIDNQSALNVIGVDKQGNPVNYTYVASIPTSLQFKANGQGVMVRRITSIGMNPPENFTSGAYLKNVHWSEVKIGNASGSEVYMDSSNSEPHTSTTAGFCGYPVSEVQVDYYSQSNEFVSVKAGGSW